MPTISSEVELEATMGAQSVPEKPGKHTQALSTHTPNPPHTSPLPMQLERPKSCNKKI